MAPRRPGNQPAPAPSEHVVTGPTSALTSFLREQGITHRANRQPNPRPAFAVEGDEEPAVPAEDKEVEVETEGTAENGNAVASGSGSAKRPAQTVKQKAAEMKKRKLADKAAFDLKNSSPAPGPAKKYDDRALGAISQCGECGKRFTVTKYTASNHLGKGLLCAPCSTEIGHPVEKLKPKVKPPPKKRVVKVAPESEARAITSLQKICISVIGTNIAEVDALGDIGSKNLERIAKIVCKHRALSAENLGLFLDISHTELSLYDCTNLKDTDFSSLVSFCPHLQKLDLRMCGRLDNDVLEAWGTGFKELKYLSLYAPYLVTFQQWLLYLGTFGEHHQLEGFGIMQSPRFDDDCIRLLVSRNPNLYNLQLSEIGKLTDLSLGLLHPLKCLTSLDISRAGVNQGMNLTDDGVVALLENCGETLVELVLDQNYLLTDRVLTEGIKIHCPRLRSLSLHSLAKLESTGVQDLFTSWVNVGLTHLSLHRCTKIENEAISALVNHSGHSLRSLNLHSVDELEDHVLKDLARSAPLMEELDVSFIRAVDDFVVKDILEGMHVLKKLFVHGNNRVSQNCPGRRGVAIRGLENYLHVEL